MSVPCATCGTMLRGRQLRFCSRRCKNVDTNNRFQNYAAQRDRGQRRKREWVVRFGGRCTRCGYAANYAAFAFHHRIPADKTFELDLRAFSNRRASCIASEAAKCELVCANCHAELHHPKHAVREPRVGAPYVAKSRPASCMTPASPAHRNTP